MRYDYVTEAGKTISQDTLTGTKLNVGPQTVALDQATTATAGTSAVPAVVRQERKPRAPAQPRAPQFPPRIAKAIIAITEEIGVIQKEGYNEFQKYRYTRWEDISERLSPLLARHKLVIVQTEINRTLLEQSDKGSVLSIIYNFTIVNEDGEYWPPVEWTGIARLRDQKGITDDKAPLKCQTQAEKSFCIKLFKIRSDEGYQSEDNHAALPKKDARPMYQEFINEMDAAAKEALEHGEPSSFRDWGFRNKDRKKTYPKDWQDQLTARFNDWVERIDAALAQMQEEDYEQEEDGK
jgi:hypothetical protein